MAKPGLKKKYLKLAGNDFKKAWKLQKAAEKKSGKKKKSTKKKATKKKTTRKKTTKKKISVKKVTKRKSTKKTVRKSTPKRKAGRMAKRKKSTTRKRRRSGGGGGKMQKVMMDGAAAMAGAIGAGVVANYIPLPDPRMKAALPIVAGIALASTKMGRGKMAQMVSVGMVAAGGLALMKQFAPNVPMLAGEEENYLDLVSPDAEERAMLGYYNEDDELDELLGAPVEVGQEFDLDDEEEDLLGESVAVAGGDFRSTGDW